MIKYNDIYLKSIEEIVKMNPCLLEIKNKKMLITGVTGMICSAVVDILLILNRMYGNGNYLMLAGRDKKRTIERFSAFAEEGKDYSFVFYDATQDCELDVDVDYIIHGAGNAHPEMYVQQPVETMLANIIGLKNLLDGLKNLKRGRLLYISSSEVYGDKDIEEKFYKENDYGYMDILNPRSCYPCSKRAAETLCASYLQEFEVDTVIARPGHIYGPTITESDSRATAQFTRKALRNENIVMKSAGTQKRSYCNVLDCASGLLTILLHGVKGEAYNISNKDSIASIRQVAEIIAHRMNKEVVFENASDLEKKGYNMMKNSALDAEKLEKLMWKPCFGLEEGVSITLQCMEI